MAKKVFKQIGRSRNLNVDLDKIKVSETTKKVLQDLDHNITKDNIENAIEVVSNDHMITVTEKDNLLHELQTNFINLLNFKNCPEDYLTLKKEAKYLAGMYEYNRWLLAQRLKKIRDNELYLEDGYTDFRSFIENEIEVVRSSVYNYIDMITYFGVQPVGHEFKLQYSKLLCILPLLKSNNPGIPKEEIRNKFLDEMNNKSKKELNYEAKRLKIKYGLINPENNLIKAKNYFLQNLPKKLNSDDKLVLQDLITKLQDLL